MLGSAVSCLLSSILAFLGIAGVALEVCGLRVLVLRCLEVLVVFEVCIKLLSSGVLKEDDATINQSV